MYNIVNVFGNMGKGSGYRQAITNIMECFNDSKIPCNFYSMGNYNNSHNFIQAEKFGNINFILSAPPYKIKMSKYNIAYFYWESDKLPFVWKKDLMSMDEIWCPCKLVEDGVKKIGFRGITRIVPTPMRKVKRNILPVNLNVYQNLFLDEKCFKFYSIFQWQYRKGYDCLIKAYLNEFKHNEDVILIIKTNPLLTDNLKHDITSFVNNIKKYIHKSSYAKIAVIDNFVTNKEIDGLHQLCDCFVLPHRGEGWGMPIARSIMHDKHLITTKYGGVTEYLDDRTASLIDHSMQPVTNMEWCKLYSSDQLWAEPKQASLQRHMRDVFSNEKDNFSKILNRDHIKNILSKEYFINFIEKEFLSERFL